MKDNPDRFNLKTSHPKLIADYLSEIKALSQATVLPEFESILGYFEDYQRFLNDKQLIQDPLRPIKEASGGSRILDVVSMKPFLRELMYTAHLAACCNLFRESSLPRSRLKPGPLLSDARKYISNPGCMNIAQSIYSRIHNMDAIRTMQLLRAAALVKRASAGMFQLALGAGSGLKDIHYVHVLPQITAQKTAEDLILTFNITLHPAAHVIVGDADPRYRDHYAQFSEEDSPPVLAFNGDTLELLKQLKGSEERKRNLVTMLRVDHRMIPDIPLFLSHLQPLIDDDCDFILSIGLGDTLDDFRGRVDLIRGVFDALENAKMRPVLFKLHGRGTLQEQWASLQFGSPGAATYQILYCKLDAILLGRAYG